jgi:hypothetical protein
LEERIFQIYSFEFFEVSRVGNRDSHSVHYFVELAIGVLVEWEALWEERILAQSLAKVRLILRLFWILLFLSLTGVDAR